MQARHDARSSHAHLTQANHALTIEAKVLPQPRPPRLCCRHPRRRRRRAAASSVATSTSTAGGGGGGGGGGGVGGELVREVEVVEGYLLAGRERPRSAQQQAVVEGGVAVG